MRRFTLVTIIVLFALLAGAALFQLVLANRGDERFPGPVSGTPLPSLAQQR
jgi:hypothetical protein